MLSIFPRRALFISFAIQGLVAGASYAQNVPTTASSPSGTITNSQPVPPMYNDAYGSDLDKNLIYRFTPMFPYTDFDQVMNAAQDGKALSTTIFTDGFNRPFQTIKSNYSVVNGQVKDLVLISDNRVQRNSRSFLPYTVNTTGMGYSNPLPFAYEDQKNYYAGKYPTEGYTSYSMTKYLSDANMRFTINYAPGKGNVGQFRGTTVRKITNDGQEVRTWELDGSGLPVSTGWYGAKQLFAEIVTVRAHTTFDAIPTSRTYTDKDGRTVMKQVAESGTGIQNYTWLTTYYVYDEMGRPRYTLPPKAVEAIAQNGWTVTTAVLDGLCFQYRYDDRGRLAQQRKPGEDDFTDIVYDRKERIVMRRSALEKAQGAWEVSYYDKLGRVIGTSLYTSSADRATLQNVIDNLNPANPTVLSWYFGGRPGEGTVPEAGVVSGNTIMSYSYYDDYKVADPAGEIYTAATQELYFGVNVFDNMAGAEIPSLSRRTLGLPVASKVRLLPAPGADASKVGDWRSSYTWYDDKGRVIYTLSNDEFENEEIHKSITGTQYDFANRMLISKHRLVNVHDAVSGSNAHVELTKNEYEAYTGRLSKVSHRVNSGAWKVLATYKYDDLGRLSSESLGGGGEVRDYAYNIRGQLRAINENYAYWGSFMYDGLSRSFGEVLCYDYGFSQPRYDGRISGMFWHGPGSKGHAYGYDYDLAGRLKSADYRTRFTSSVPVGSWNKTDLDYTVSNLTYDKNGNIRTMDQRGMGMVNGAVQPVGMDQLHYTYAADGNRLMEVKDDVEEDYSIGDFIDGNTTGDDYAYDAAGNLTMDKNKGIEQVTYTWFNKPQTIVFANGTKICYSYDAGGNKLQELISTEETTKTTDYIANFVYRNDTLQYMLTGQGRTTISPADNSSNEEFFVKDHLGNIRSIIDVKEYVIQQYLASYELASANLETLLFDKVAEIREDKPGGTEGDKAGRLNAGDTARITGTSLLLKVMAGDQVELQAFNYYEGYDSATDRPLSPGALLQSLVTTLTGGAGGLDEGESHDPDIVPKLFSVANYAGFNNLLQGITDSSRPLAYLNYVLFDRRMKLVSEGSGSFQVNGDGQWGVIGTNGTAIAIPENGYFGVFIVNGSKKDVWFDQLVVEVRRGQLKEENHYYPHGLPMGHIGSVAAGETENRRKYQSNEYITDAGLNWMDFNFRQYDPQLGRFNSVDPLAGSTDMVSPYAAMGNAPESLTDPTGLRAGPPLKITKPGVGYGLIDNSMDKGYAFMLQMNADLVRMGMDPIGDFGGGSGGGGGGGGGSFSISMSAGGLWWENIQSLSTAGMIYKAMSRPGYTAYFNNGHFSGYSQNRTRYSITAGTTPQALQSAGYRIDQSDGVSIMAHRYIQPGDITTLQREDLMTIMASLVLEDGSEGIFNNEKWMATDIMGAFSAGTLIPSGALGFVENTGTGRFLANGYRVTSKAEMAAAMKLAKPLTKGIAVMNFAATAIAVTDDFSHGRYKSASARAAVWGIAGVASFIPVVGWGVSISIGIADAIWGEDFYNYVEKNW